MSLFMLAAYGFACAAVYHLCPAKIRWVVLLLASYGFYASRSLAGLPFILATTGTTWLAARALPIRWAAMLGGTIAVLLLGVWGSGFSEASFIYFNF